MTYLTDFLYLVGTPFFLPPFLYKIVVKKKYRESTRGMLGMNLSGLPWKQEASRRNLWLHAVSVGETVAGKAVLSEWVKRDPNARIVASTVTETGQIKARSLLDEAEEFTYYPIDFSPVVRRFLNHYNPHVYIMMETEIWPNFLREAAGRGVKIFLANGKLSDRSFSRWMKVRRFFTSTFDAITAACVQTEEDREKFASLLGRPDRILVTGNCKFDSSGKPLSESDRSSDLERLDIPEKAPVLVVGSTHQGEEEIILDAWEAVREKIPGIRLILAPRHPERFDEVKRLLSSRDIAFSLYTKPEKNSPDVVLVDTIGVLARLYGLGWAAVVGGSFVPIGGHNLLEAAVHGIPVLYGPHMHKQPEIVRFFREGEGGIQLEADLLASTLEHLFSNRKERERLGNEAGKTVMKSRGSAGRTVDFIRKFLD